MPKLVAVMSVFLLASALAGVAGADENFRATLTGDQEVPPVVTDTSGRATVQINKDQTEGEITLTVNEGVDVIRAHIHCAPVGVNGPIVVILTELQPGRLNIDGRWISNATFTDASISNPACGATVAELAASMRAGNTYVNVHTVANPGGEIRGQLRGRGRGRN